MQRFNVSTKRMTLAAAMRYLLHDVVDEFAEEIVLAAFQRQGGAVSWESARTLLTDARPHGNLDESEQAIQITWALDFLRSSAGWHAPIIEWRADIFRPACRGRDLAHDLSRD